MNDKTWRSVAEARRGLDIIARMGNSFLQNLENDRNFQQTLSRSPLRLRCIVENPSTAVLSGVLEGARILAANQIRDATKRFMHLGWEVRLTRTVPTASCIIVDGSNALVEMAPPKNGIINVGDSIASEYARHFEQVWNSCEAQRNSSTPQEFIYEDLLSSGIPENARSIIVASKQIWDGIIADLIKNPVNIHAMTSRKFEELIAELLLREGLEVDLTRPTKDGGRDIIARAQTSVVGNHIYLVECKKYGVKNPVEVSLVRALYGIITAENATGGILVTTSHFTRGSVEFQRTVQNRLWLKDYEKVRSWLNSSQRSTLRGRTGP